MEDHNDYDGSMCPISSYSSCSTCSSRVRPFSEGASTFDVDPLGNVLFYRRRAMDVLCRCCNGVDTIQVKVEAVPEDEILLPLRHRMRHHRHYNQLVQSNDHESTRRWLRNDSQV